MEFWLISFDILVSISGFSFMAWTLRQDRQEFRVLLERVDANSARVADHTRHIADLAAKTLATADKTLETVSRNERLSVAILRKIDAEGEA